MLIAGAINFVFILCTYQLGKMSSGQAWTAFGEKIAGKWGHRAVLLILLFWSVFYVSLDIEQFTMFYRSVYMRETPAWFLQLLIGIVILITARWGFSTLVYIADGTFIVILIGIIFILVIFTGDADYQMLPALITNHDLHNVFADVISVISWIGEWFIFLFIMPQLKFDKNTLRNLMLSNMLVMFAVFITWLLVLLNFGNHYASQLKFPVLQLIRSTSFTGLIGNADPLFIGLWATAMIVHDAFLIYVGVTCLAYLLKFKENKPLISLMVGTATVAAFQYSQNTTLFQKNLTEFGFISFWVMIDGLPLYYWLIAFLRGQLGRKKFQ